MRVVIVVVIVIISMFMPYLAQVLPGKCWERMVTCGSDDDMTDKEKEKDCCKAFIREMDEIECICTGAIYIYVANATAYEDLNVFLSSCNVNTLDVLCPGMGLPSSPTSNLLPPPSDDSSLTPPSDKSSLTPPSDDSSPTPPKSEATTGNNLHVIVPAVVASLVVLIVAVVILVVCLCKPKPNVTISTQNGNDFAGASDASLSTVPLVPLPLAIVTDKPINQKEDVVHGELARLASENDDFMTAESLQYEMRTLEVATNNFSDDHIIGRGGFGIVYKGSLLGGREIAVKKLAKGSSQGDTEFKNEVLLLAKLQHRNLVKLVGFCLENKEKILLYEMVPNKSLDYFLFDPKKQGQLNWSSRYNIIKGTARGMLYLHEDSPVRIIHRDLKAANVLLDLDMNPKIADFGLARICANEQTHIDTSRVVGTYGYMAPEYLLHGQYSVKSDVYSFGVLVLEIVCGRKVGDIICKSEGNLKLLSYAWKCWLDAEPLELLDPILKDESCSNDEVIKCIHIGLLCVQEDISKRPPMATITHMLNSQVSVVGALSMPMPPAYLYNSSSNQSTTTTTTRSNTSSSMPWSQSYPHGLPNLECR